MRASERSHRNKLRQRDRRLDGRIHHRRKFFDGRWQMSSPKSKSSIDRDQP
jgi:hypothetical protein